MLMAINEAFVDGAGVPIQNIRVRHTIVLEDPFPDPPALAEHVPEKSPEPVFAQVPWGLSVFCMHPLSCRCPRFRQGRGHGHGKGD